MDFGGGDADEEEQSIRVRQEVHPGSRLAPVFAPFFCHTRSQPDRAVASTPARRPREKGDHVLITWG
ncbi:hypothetical protein GCM10018783_18610 [Streptomyces griseosporeus]|nr:hypothetical protein GCM10018783_18610 [Streptomyces griseosporeus]